MPLEPNDPRLPQIIEDQIQSIPEPNEDNILECLLALKEAVETLKQLRSDVQAQPVTFRDLEKLQVIDILPNGVIENKLPIGNESSNTLGMLKFCDGVTENYGEGMGWYYRRPDAVAAGNVVWVKLWDEEDGSLGPGGEGGPP